MNFHIKFTVDKIQINRESKIKTNKKKFSASLTVIKNTSFFLKQIFSNNFPF